MDFTEIKKDTREIIEVGNRFADLMQAFLEKTKGLEVTDEMRDLASKDPEMLQLEKDLEAMMERVDEELL